MLKNPENNFSRKKMFLTKQIFLETNISEKNFPNEIFQKKNIKSFLTTELQEKNLKKKYF